MNWIIRIFWKRFGYAAVVGVLVPTFCGGVRGSDAQRTQPLIAVLRSNAGPFEKARACQQLGELGTEEAVPALAELLSDEHLSAYARSGLEGIGGPAAAEALRAAAGRLRGKELAGVVNSLGVVRDEGAVGILGKLAQDPDSGAAKQALLALGKIANNGAIALLQRALSEGSEELRSAAASGCLLAAARQLAVGNAAQAQLLYDNVLNAKLPTEYRLAATRGAILSRKTDQVAFLIEKLRSTDRFVRNAGLITIREIPSDELVTALNEELRRAKPEMQVQLLAASADCHNENSLQIIEDKANSDDSEVRKSALRLLGRIGDPATASFLLKAVTANRNTEEIAIAMGGIERMEGSVIDDLIVKEMGSATDATVRVRLIRLVDARAIITANEELLKQAADRDAQVAIAAFETLKSRASGKELSRLIALTKASQDNAVRRAAEGAVYGDCARMGEAGAKTVLAELKEASKVEDMNSWVNVLASLGYAPALPAVEGEMNDAEEIVARNAINQLGQWPGPEPIDALFIVSEKGSTPERRRAALASVIKLARAAADEHQRPDVEIVGWFERAGKDSNSVTERRMIISGLGRLNHADSLRLLSSYLDETDLQNEAAVAILQIAPALIKEGADEAIQSVLRRIADTTQNAALRDQARKLADSGTGLKELALFDGSSLIGWDGDTKVWGVKGGVIAGGSMAGNPRNEFLATTRSYTNFVLRLEYKLSGTEGFINSGVQFHSVRVVQPPNEMNGYQADIGAGYSGCLYDESRRNKFLARPPEEQIKRLERPGEWNRYEVRCQASRIQIFLNGEQTVDYTEPDGAIPHYGRIGLQIHGGSKAEAFFRNITLVERKRLRGDPTQ